MSSRDQELSSHNKGRLWGQRGRLGWTPAGEQEWERPEEQPEAVLRDSTWKERRLAS